jgi:SEC-C motif-containing protein
VSGAFGRPACPCGTGRPYDACCGPLHLGAEQAGSPEQLMRSRYSAYAVGDTAYLLRTWHPRTRPVDLVLDPATRWTGLVVHDAGADEVEFTASWSQDGGTGSLRERSRFEVRGGRWLYVDGETSAV